MIQWKKYDTSSKRDIVSHKDYLVTNGKETIVAHHCNLGAGVYGWLDVNSFVLKDITHYAELNLPGEVDHETM